MRTITKGVKPKILVDNADKWTTEILEIIDKGENPTNTQKRRYNHAQIKTAIINETYGKCAYCESLVIHVDHGDIEHLVPKSKATELAFAWENLTLACRICNQNKGDYYDPHDDHSSLVDPTREDPMDHFTFHREILAPIPGNAKALKTYTEIDLGRSALVERRRERIEFLDGLVGNYVNADVSVKDILLKDLRKKTTMKYCEYSTFCVEYLETLVRRGILPPAP